MDATPNFEICISNIYVYFFKYIHISKFGVASIINKHKIRHTYTHRKIKHIHTECICTHIYRVFRTGGGKL